MIESSRIRISSGLVHLNDLTADSITIADLSVLERIPRFGGHTPHLHSVAEHSMRVRAALMAIAPALGTVGLVHDGSEAYLLDIPRPVKKTLPGYYDAEAKIQDSIYSAFGLTELAKSGHSLLKMADDMVLNTEYYESFGLPEPSGGLTNDGTPWVYLDPSYTPGDFTRAIVRAFRKLPAQESLLQTWLPALPGVHSWTLYADAGGVLYDPVGGFSLVYEGEYKLLPYRFTLPPEGSFPVGSFRDTRHSDMWLSTVWGLDSDAAWE